MADRVARRKRLALGKGGVNRWSCSASRPLPLRDRMTQTVTSDHLAQAGQGGQIQGGYVPFQNVDLGHGRTAAYWEPSLPPSYRSGLVTGISEPPHATPA